MHWDVFYYSKKEIIRVQIINAQETTTSHVINVYLSRTRTELIIKRKHYDD
jgi:hypothetical protein